jgi:hypothetical protein
MPDIKPDRHNWKQFCKESELTSEEHAVWNEMARAIKEAEARGDGSLFDFITAEVQTEDEELRWLEDIQSGDWSDLVASADASRRLKRAEIAAWQKYLERREQ